MHCLSRLAAARNDIQQMITVQQIAFLIHHHQTIAVTIKGDTQIGRLFDNPLLQLLGMGRATALIDIEAVRLRTHRDDIRTKLVKYPRPSLV